MRYIRHGTNVVGVVALAALVALLIYFPQREWLEGIVDPVSPTTVRGWVDDFMISALWGFRITVAAIVVWYCVAQFFFRVARWQDGKKRLWWLSIGVLAIAASLGVGFWVTERTQEGGHWAWVFYAVNSTALYYFATALFSPDGFKYTALGARRLRFWR